MNRVPDIPLELDFRRQGTLREIYAYSILAHLSGLPGHKTTGTALARGLSLPYNATFYRACEHMVCLGLLRSEGLKFTKRYWLPLEKVDWASLACWQWADYPSSKS
jgi:hypothetical protein